jgi:hypothetical protein
VSRNGKKWNDIVTHSQVECDLRQLALVDRIIGLEAELAHMRMSQTDKDLIAMRASTTWRVGRVALGPLVLARSLVRRVKSW